jgi:hypothetical protein
MKSLEFIQQVSAGESAKASETLSNLLSTIALDALEAKKQDIAANLFKGGVVEEGLTTGKRLISRHGSGEHESRVYKDPEYNEYQVHFYKGGKHMGEGPVSYHDDKSDAQGTAETEIQRMNSKKK